MKRGAITPGNQLPSEYMLADQFKISRHTVRKALDDLESEGLIFREQGRGTFCAYPAAAKGQTVAVVTTYISEYIFPAVIRGIEEVLSAAGCLLLLASTGNAKSKEATCLENLLQQKIAGLIIEPTQSARENGNLVYYRELESRGIPYLMLHAYYPELDPAYIIMDDEKGGYLATQHLIQLGHRRIAGLFKADDLQGLKRRIGFLKALQDYGLEPIPELIGAYETEELYSYPDQFTRNLLQQTPPPTGMVCYNDQVALFVLEALREEGIKVPEDFSLISFDDSSLAVASEVKLSGIEHPKVAMGRQAARLILDMLDNKVYKPRHIYRPQLVLRASCARKKKPEKGRIERRN
ncbi:MAG: GntR family transcriptional regulator [Firmicutes bacterium]|nr:GntR family transcriptional regulator [Bacillota bacterium]